MLSRCGLKATCRKQKHPAFFASSLLITSHCTMLAVQLQRSREELQILALEKDRALRYYEKLIADAGAEADRLGSTASETIQSCAQQIKSLGSVLDAIDALSADERRIMADGLCLAYHCYTQSRRDTSLKGLQSGVAPPASAAGA